MAKNSAQRDGKVVASETGLCAESEEDTLWEIWLFNL